MTYQVDGCRGRDGRVDHERVFEVIAAGAADLIALQGLGRGNQTAAEQFARQLGMTWYAQPETLGNAYLSYHSISGLRQFDLGGGGRCLRADLDVYGKRLHLFNICLTSTPGLRQAQIATLLGPDLLGSRELVCPTLAVGDFADFWWGPGNLNLALMLRKASRPLWHATYPTLFPLFGRDRAYLRGELRVLETSILRQRPARQATSHLPLVLTLQINDPRKYLRESLTGGMKIPAGEPMCG